MNKEEIANKLKQAFEQGPEATREFLDTPEGMSDECRELLKEPVASDKNKVSIEDKPNVIITELIPTQRFIDLMQSVSFPLSSAESLKKSITTKKGFGTIIISKSKEGIIIIDGHHRWSGIFGIRPDGIIDAKLVNWPGVNAKQKLAAAQLAIAAWKGAGQKQPSKGGEPKFNVLGKSAEEINKMIMGNLNNPGVVDPKVKDQGGLLNDKMINDIISDPDVIFKWAGISDGEKNPEVIRKAISLKVSNNLEQMKNYVEGAPPREDMPQFDPNAGGPEFTQIEADLKDGDLDLSPPFESKVIKTYESFIKYRNKKNQNK